MNMTWRNDNDHGNQDDLKDEGDLKNEKYLKMKRISKMNTISKKDNFKNWRQTQKNDKLKNEDDTKNEDGLKDGLESHIASQTMFGKLYSGSLGSSLEYFDWLKLLRCGQNSHVVANSHGIFGRLAGSFERLGLWPGVASMEPPLAHCIVTAIKWGTNKICINVKKVI